jgi:acyl-CoA reductase-like NAD-dependent aldehyde dehydrogenase
MGGRRHGRSSCAGCRAADRRRVCPPHPGRALVRNPATGEVLAFVIQAGVEGAHAVRAVENGVISVNTGWSVHMEMPFGGVKRGGVGRELGPSALEHYSEQKSVFISDE